MRKKQRSACSILPLVLLLSVHAMAQPEADSTASVNPPEKLSVPEGMVLIPGGEAWIGSDWNEMAELAEIGHKVPHMSINHARWWYGDETPRHPATIEPFLMDAHEVTNSEYKQFVQESHYLSEGEWYKYATEGRENHPVVNVTYRDAEAYAEWTGKRLPTEEEWEWAAMGGSDARWYPWGDTITAENANWRHQGESFFAGLVRLLGMRGVKTVEVGSYAPNGYGLYDVVGNVCEWTASPYLLYPGFEPNPNGVENEAQKLTPEEAESRRVCRSGSWGSSNPVFVRVPNRHGFPRESSRRTLGFRCAKDIGE